MKKFLLLFVALCILVSFGVANGFNEFPNQPKAEATETPKALEFFPNMSLDGVAVWLPELNEVAAGALTDVAVLYEFINVSAMVATTITTTESPTEDNPGAMVGPSVGINIPNLVKKLGGTWISDSIASSVGVGYLYDMRVNKFRLGIYGSLVRINLDPIMKKLGLL